MNAPESFFAAPREVIVIDSSVADWKTLTAGLDPTIPVILLPAGADGLAALAAALADYGRIDALHLVSHGGNGRLNLGELRLTQTTLADQADTLAALASHFSPDSDLLLYGCSVASDASGQVFVGALSAALNGVDIAASTDRTGPLSLHGDWDLEFAEGEVETVLPFTVQGMEGIDECLGCVAGGNPEGTTTSCQPGFHWEDPLPLADTAPPFFTSFTPVDGATNVVVGSNIVVTFNEPIAKSSGNITLDAATGADTVIAVTDAQVSISGSTLTINPTADLVAGMSYNVLIDSGAIRDVSSNANAFSGLSAGDLNFTTAGGVADTTAPTFDVAPATTSPTTSGFTLTGSLDEAGTVYYVVVADGASAPSAAQVKAGQNASSGVALTSGSQAVTTGSFDASVNVSGLSAGTAYDVYVIAQDDEATPNLMPTPIKVDATTSAPADITAPTLDGAQSLPVDGATTVGITDPTFRTTQRVIKNASITVYQRKQGQIEHEKRINCASSVGKKFPNFLGAKSHNFFSLPFAEFRSK